MNNVINFEKFKKEKENLDDMNVTTRRRIVIETIQRMKQKIEEKRKI